MTKEEARQRCEAIGLPVERLAVRSDGVVVLTWWGTMLTDEQTQVDRVREAAFPEAELLDWRSAPDPGSGEVLFRVQFRPPAA